MKLETRHIGGNPAVIIELTIKGDNANIIETLTNRNNLVDYDLIQNLRDIADELEEHNQAVSNLTEFK